MSVLVAEGAGVRHHRRWVVRGLDAVVEPGDLVALTGPPGSGRTTALLALAGRFRLTEGKIHTPPGTPPSARETPATDETEPIDKAEPVDETEAPPPPTRRGVSLGHVAGVTDPEPTATVADHVRERLALLGRPRRRGVAYRCAELLCAPIGNTDLEAVPLLGLPPGLRGRELSPYQKQLLGLVLALVENPAVVALDDWDLGLDDAERADLLQTLTDLTAEALAVIITARTHPHAATRVIELGIPA
ncbi:ATP-binding cassette domain-containing protein [Actinoplanes sp. NPDC089786]|uniref:ATP-binding cassette domain-containing protein n=1 Tax=Actinoplanes sp. NPDC089786 TaxID=3155185 RepID=UPI00342C23A2